MAFSDGTEPAVIDRLRADGDLLVSLVAVEEAQIVGHIAFSPATLSVPGRWVTLGPISVTPERQRRGIGKALIAAGFARLRALGVAGCVLTGNPAVYASSGFRNDLGLTASDTPNRNVMGLSFAGPPPTGPIVFARAFG
ncbi:putative acetyltransferase [Jannaschia donghaensis]|uniref:Putative acetyltransferase n=2 Tax=Jannaschia donghaensis TaxID=420998 RepID=A0A0M6YDA5_9RHOB|nr:putative acetyltransferase [Jannaschia donghaensis]